MTLLHKNFEVVKLLYKNDYSHLFMGKIRNYENINQDDRSYIGPDNIAVIKRYDLVTSRRIFKKEVKILKRIKSLKLVNNGNFPVPLSAFVHMNAGEILMSYTGENLD